MILDDSHNLFAGFRVGISQHTVDIEKEEPEYSFPVMGIYVLIRNMTGTSITECKKLHADSSLETAGKKKRKGKWNHILALDHCIAETFFKFACKRKKQVVLCKVVCSNIQFCLLFDTVTNFFSWLLYALGADHYKYSHYRYVVSNHYKKLFYVTIIILCFKRQSNTCYDK